MATRKDSQLIQPSQISFGPFMLKTYPPISNLRFRSNHPVTFPQQCLLDNLWNLKNTKNFCDIVQATAGHFAFLNSQIKNPTQPENPLDIALKPNGGPITSEVKTLKVSLAQADRTIYELREQVRRLEESKKQWEKDLKKKEENWEIFPSLITEVKALVYDQVLRDNRQTQGSYQELFRDLITSDINHFPGLALTSTTFRGQQETAFSYITATVDLDTWRSRKVGKTELSITKLMEMGLITHMYLSRPSQARILKNEKLAQIAMQLSENLKIGEDIEMTVNSIPPCYESKFLEDARSEILFRIIQDKPIIKHVAVNEADLITAGEVALDKQIQNYRCFTKAYEQETFFEEASLVAEDKRIRIYVEDVREIMLTCKSRHNPDRRLTAHYGLVRAKGTTIIQGYQDTGEFNITAEDQAHDLEIEPEEM